MVGDTIQSVLPFPTTPNDLWYWSRKLARGPVAGVSEVDSGNTGVRVVLRVVFMGFDGRRTGKESFALVCYCIFLIPLVEKERIFNRVC